MSDGTAPIAEPKGSPVPWWLAWAAMAVIVAVALFVGVSRDDGPQSAQDRVTVIAKQLKCPTCVGESAAESNSESAKAIRIDIAERIAQGQTDDEILAFYPTRFENILVTPGSSGLIGLVWILPVVFGALALAGLVLAFVRWRRMPTVHATDADRELVAKAQSGVEPGNATGGASGRGAP